MSFAATSQAKIVGTATPLPENWVTPIIVTATSTPLNAATVQYIAQMATAQAFTTGTPTPTPSNVQTATPTAEFEFIDPIIIPTATTIPSPTPTAIPPVLIGKIVFLSDRETPDEDGKPRAYMYDLETGQFARLTAPWPHEIANARDVWSADQRFRVFTKDIQRYIRLDGAEAKEKGEWHTFPSVFWYDYLYDAEEQLTDFGSGIAYEGVWSPTSNQIAFVSTDGGDDDIYVMNHDGSGLRQLTDNNAVSNGAQIGKDSFVPEINKHPSFSPDGQQIVFYSTRTGNSQLWIMNIDGSDQRPLMDWNPYNDWDPVWIKYDEAPRPPDQ